jgi:hypothetical protein
MESYGTELLGTAGVTGPVGVEALPVAMTSIAVEDMDGLLRDRVELERVKARLASVEEAFPMEKSRRTTAERAFRHVAERLRAEAIERDWCSEYDEFVEEVNAEIVRMGGAGGEYLQLQTSERDFEVTVTVSLTMTKTISGKSEEDVREWVRDNDDWKDGVQIDEGWDLDSLDLEEVRADES